jgi:hypothetical protein
MEARLIRRPVTDLLSGRSQCVLSFSTTTLRHQESYRRTKQKLNIKPDISFLSSGKKSQQDHIIFNPPSSAPSVLHTPLIFLPKGDKRKPLFEKAVAMHPKPAKLPPIIGRFKPVGVRHHLTDADIEEIRSLRTNDPDKWTARRLAYKYNCSIFFISMCCEAPAEKKERDREKEDAMKARWGPRRRKAREDREKRIQLALRDE